MKGGPRLCTPSMSKVHIGHFQTWLVQCTGHAVGSKMLDIDEKLPSGILGHRARRCHYVFTSKTEMEKLEILVHFKTRKLDQHKRCKRKVPVQSTKVTLILHCCTITSAKKNNKHIWAFYLIGFWLLVMNKFSLDFFPFKVNIAKIKSSENNVHLITCRESSPPVFIVKISLHQLPHNVWPRGQSYTVQQYRDTHGS